MRLAIIADLRVEHTRNWLKLLEHSGHELLVLSTYPYPLKNSTIKYHVLPGVFRPGNSFVKTTESIESEAAWKQKFLFILQKRDIDVWLRPLWYRLFTLDIIWQSITARYFLKRFKPDVLLAFRTQNEGYIAALARTSPLALFVWGQDFVNYAENYSIHKWLTRWTLKRVDSLLADCHRDIKLAKEMGYAKDKPTHVMPGNGGVDLSIFPSGKTSNNRERLIVYPRGFNSYVRLDNLLEAFKKLYSDTQYKDIKVILLIQPLQIKRVQAMVIAHGLPLENVVVTRFLSKADWSKLLQETLLIVSPSITDGTPNSMLEAMACGAIPVMGRLESIEEWIDDGQNGILFDSEKPEEIESAFVQAFSDIEFCNNAQKINRRIVEEQANIDNALPQLLKAINIIKK